MYRWSYTRHAIGMLTVVLLLMGMRAPAQIYASTQTNGANGLCVGCYVQNPTMASDTGIYTTYSTMRLTVALLNAYTYQQLGFGTTASANQLLTIVMESTTGVLLDASVLGGLQVTTYYGGVSNNDTKSSSSISISLLSPSSTKHILRLRVTKPFDMVELKLNAGIASALTNLRVYSAFYSNSTLPVKLTSFDGYRDGDIARLEWATASEIDNDHFAIERSSEGEVFEPIATVAGMGNSNKYTTYAYEDKEPLSGASYYRLRQVDYDGQCKLSDIISIAGSEFHQPVISVLQNPFTDVIAVRYVAYKAGPATIKLIDMQGNTIQSIHAESNEGINEQIISGLQYLTAGQYILQLCITEGLFPLRAIKF